MDSEEKEILRILKQHGAVLTRTKTHRVWKFPDGRIHVMPSTPSDRRTWANQLAQLRKFLDLEKPERKKNPNRKRKVGVERELYRSTLTIDLGRKSNLDGLVFPSLKKPKLDCFPLRLESFYLSPIQAIVKHFFDYR